MGGLILNSWDGFSVAFIYEHNVTLLQAIFIDSHAFEILCALNSLDHLGYVNGPQGVCEPTPCMNEYTCIFSREEVHNQIVKDTHFSKSSL